MEHLNENLRKKRELENRTKRFAVAVFRFLDALPVTSSNRVIVHQIGKSASSVGANYREANRSESCEDFLHKIGIVLKECSETGYWLEVLRELRSPSAQLEDLWAECNELIRIFQRTRTTMRGKLQARKLGMEK